MEKIVLQNKPLVEAIFELKWDLPQTIDPHYKIFIGRIYDQVEKDYPYYEELPTVRIPEEMIPYIVQYRFRKAEKQWPLIQIGPKIMTFNDTENYLWNDFERRVHNLIEVFYKTHPKINELTIKSVHLRYIDAIDFDYKDNIFDFLKEKMKISLNIEKSLFDETNVKQLPNEFEFKVSFQTEKPKGLLRLRFVRGKRLEKDALIWETELLAQEEDAPKNAKELKNWLKKAHEVAHNWFFKTIEGELYRRFK